MRTSSQTLIILSPAFPEAGPESTWVYSQQLMVKDLKESFPELSVVVLTFLYPEHTGSYTWNGVKVISFNGMKTRKWARPLLWIKIWKAVRDIHRRGSMIGFLSFWCGECALLGTYLGKYYRVRHFCWICGQDARKSNRYVKLIRPGADSLVAMSQFLAEEFHKNHGIKPAYVIPNGIDPYQFKSRTHQKKDIDILGVGSLEPLKQYRLFARIVKTIDNNIAGIHAILCGDGPEREILRTLIKDLKLENTLHLRGLTPHQGVVELMQRAKVLLHTSSYEGFSTVCLEALYAGAHVVSFCDPMQGDIPHWHIVKTEDEMINKALELLGSSDTAYHPVLANNMKDSANAFMGLVHRSSASRANISFYDGIAERYNETMHKDPANGIIRQKVCEKLTRLLPSGWVMDFGGGTGLDLEWLTKDHRIYFCEPSVRMREKAIAYNRDILHSDQIVFLETDQTDYTRWQERRPFARKMDGILCNFGVLNYISDIRHLFAMLAGVLKSGGHFIIVILKLSFQKRLRWHRRHAIYALVAHKPFVMYIPGETGKQTITVHTVEQIRAASSPYFTLLKDCSLGRNDFIFIHLIRK